MTYPTGDIALVLDGDLDLNGDNTDPSGLVFRIEALGDGADWGNPQAITRTIEAWLTDGSTVVEDGADNRTLTLPVRVIASTSVALAAGEAALHHRCGRPTLLEWTPPWDDESPVTSVFRVWDASLAGVALGQQPGPGDLNERLLTRYYTLSLTAEPYARSEVQTLVSALESVPTSDDDYVFEQVDDCSSTTGWTGSPNAVESGGTDDASVAVPFSTVDSSWVGGGGQWWFGGAKYTVTATRAGTVDMSDSPYLIVKAGMPGVTSVVSVVVDGTTLEQVSANGRTRTYVMPTGVTSFSSVVVKGEFFTKQQMSTYLRVYDVSRSSGSGTVATGKQTARTMWIDGSARSFGSVSVQHESDGLGDVVLYTVPSSPAGYVPAMQVYQTDGPTPTADTDAVSGVKQAIDLVSYGSDSPPTFLIPAALLMEGTYGALLRVKVTTPEDYQFGVAASVADASGVTIGTIYLASTVVTFADTSYAMVWVGAMTLPPSAVPLESDLNVKVNVSAFLKSSAGDTDPVYLDELWLFNLTDGAVSVLSAGAAQRVWFDSPDDDRLYPAVFTGSEADRSDAVGAPLGSVQSVGRHRLLPGLMDVFTVTTGAADATAAVSYYRRWHTHAAG